MKARFSSFAASLVAIGLASCAAESRLPDPCQCPASSTLASGAYVDDKTIAKNPGPGSDFPHARGTDFELVIDSAPGRAKLSYMLDGKRITETWRRK